MTPALATYPASTPHASSIADLLNSVSTKLNILAYKQESSADARQSFLTFQEITGRDRLGNPLRNDPHNRLLCALYQACYESGRWVSDVEPAGLGKSTRARNFANWALGNDPRMSICFISAEESASKKNVSLCRQLISRDAYRDIFPNVIPDNERSLLADKQNQVRGWTKEQFFLKPIGNEQSADPAMESSAAIPFGEFRRVDMLCIDDLMSRTVANSDTLREKFISAGKETWLDGRLSNGRFCLALQNCWHTEDFAHKLLTDKRFCSVWIGASEDTRSMRIWLWNPPEDFNLLTDPSIYDAIPVQPSRHGLLPDFQFHIPFPNDPKLYSYESLSRAEVSQPEIFRRSWRTQAASVKDRMFPSWGKRICDNVTVAQLMQIDEQGGLPWFRDDNFNRFVFGGGMDISSGKRRGDAIWFLARDGSHKIYPVEHHRGTYCIAEVADILESAWRRGLRWSVFYVESVGVQDKIMHELQIHARAAGRNYAWSHTIQPFITGSNKQSPELGLPSIDVELSTGQILWAGAESARRDVAHADDWRQCESEFADCPRFPEPGRTPDGPMGFWFARRALENAAFVQSSVQSRGLSARTSPLIPGGF